MAAVIRIRKRTALKFLSNSCASAISGQIRHKTCEIDGENVGETCVSQGEQGISLGYECQYVYLYWYLRNMMADIGAHSGGRGVKNGHETLSASPGMTLAESLRQKLEGAIAAGHLEPGSRLDEQEIAQRFGVSRTPVREAFRLMAANNLVELRGRQGATVRSIKAQALIEMFQVMAELEGLCARLAARRVSQAWGAEIGEIHQRLVAAGETGDIDVFYDINQEFHEAIYEASRNSFLADQTRKLRNQVAAYRRRVTRMPNRIADTVREHEAIMQAILAHDPERAHSAMRDHVNLLGDNLLDFLAAFE
ncbi:GntR family transcriptional regulator [Bradyrhizobium zhanjiangense]|uniref:GntR family transcriptional regulator n=1 Tax=Bradyrhizobium zhanjiangense TaxID=1325107 RepID=A0A4Q0QZK6_9BRAD|nr:GntR family transcriptional regulator [Bradyrhizobium zhanjiangense]